MKIRITKHFDFEASHWLPKVPQGHKCGRMHGHSYRVTIAFACEEEELLDGMIVDYAEIALAWDRLHECLDHRTLNDVPGLENPTTEVLTPWIWNMLHEVPTSERFRRFLAYVTVKESRTTTCTYPL